MHFLQMIRNTLCHPEAIVLRNGPSLHCETCQQEVNLYAMIAEASDTHFRSSQLAQAYFAWTQDDQVPLTFTLLDIEGILPKRVRGQTLHHLQKCVQFLRAVNGPFTTEPCPPPDDMGDFFKQYVGILSRHRIESLNDDQNAMLKGLLNGMEQLVQSDEFANPIEYYFQKLVPFVQRAHTAWIPLEASPPKATVAEEIWEQLKRSSAIRKTFGPYSIPFDIIHVMMGCYVGSSDADLVSNWVLDFMVRVCEGRYFWSAYPESPFVKAMQHFLQKEITYRNRVHLYQVIREIQKGNAIDCLPVFWQHFAELQKFINEKFNVPQVPYDVTQVAIEQTFPAVLFQECSDYLGFIIAMGYISIHTQVKKGIIEKGSFKKARGIHKTISSLVQAVRKFNASSEILWTNDTLQQFFVSIPNLEQELVQLIQLICTHE